MARRRLTLGPLSGDTLDVPRAEHPGSGASSSPDPFPAPSPALSLSLSPTAPIARVAAEAAGAAALQELTETVARARDLRESAEMHRRIYMAIRQRDGALARESMDRHLQLSYEAQASEERTAPREAALSSA